MTSSVYIGDSLSDFFGSESASRRPSYIVTGMASADTANTPLPSPTAGPESPQRIRKFNSRTNALEVIADLDLSGRTILITGTTAGIGTETARALALRGAHVVMANRNIVASEDVKKKILEEKPDANIDFIMCDLSSLQSVQAAAKEYKEKHWPIHVLILNAGVFAPSQKMTIDGLETCHGVNHVAHQYLLRELLPLMRQTVNCRVVVVSSQSHAHTGLKADQSTNEKVERLCPKDASELSYRLYAYSKMCNILMAMKLHRDEHLNGMSIYVLHPGTMIGTSISRGYGVLGRVFNIISSPFTKTVSQGAACSVYCAVHPEIDQVSGKYWESCWDDERNLHKELAHDEALQEALWARTDELLDQFEAKRQPISAVSEGNTA